MAVGCDGKEISEGRWKERGELLFGKKLEQGRFVIIEGPLKGSHKLHDCASQRVLFGVAVELLGSKLEGRYLFMPRLMT